MQRDQCTTIKAKRALAPVAAVTDNTAFVSEILDVAGFDAATFIGVCGSIADADVTFTVLMEEGDAANLSDAAAVADSDLIGTEALAAPLFSDDNKTLKLGYKGTKRYLRVTITPANNSGNIFLAGIWLQGHPRTLPQNTQVV